MNRYGPLASFILALILSGCGQMGPLDLPKELKDEQDEIEDAWAAQRQLDSERREAERLQRWLEENTEQVTAEHSQQEEELRILQENIRREETAQLSRLLTERPQVAAEFLTYTADKRALVGSAWQRPVYDYLLQLQQEDPEAYAELMATDTELLTLMETGPAADAPAPTEPVTEAGDLPADKP